MLNLLCWNVNGLKRKITDVDFLDYISEFDFICLNETWLSEKDSYCLDINGYLCQSVYGNKSAQAKKGCYSGGISFYYKKKFKNKITILCTNKRGIIWVKFAADLFPHGQDVYLCHVYIPPSDSKVTQTVDFDFFDQLETDILKYCQLGKIYLTGDFNSRTSNAEDFFLCDKYLDENLSFINTCNIPVRSTQDKIIDTYGRRLLDT